MDLPDNNVLLNAFRPDAPHHTVAKQWLEGALNEGQSIRLFPTVEAGFLRVATHPKVFTPPSLFNEAAEFLRLLCSARSVSICSWTVSERNRWIELCQDLEIRSNDCNDAMLAAVCLEGRLRLVTFDQGFKRFPRLQLLLLK